MPGLDSVLSAATPVTSTIDKAVGLLPSKEESSGLTPDRAADIVDAQDTQHAISKARRHPLWYRLLSSAVPGAIAGGLGLGAKAGVLMAGDRSVGPAMTAGAGAGAALGGGAGIATELFDRATEGSRLRKANKTLAGVSEAVKHRLADPDVATHAQQYQAAREYPMRMTELGALLGGLGGSAYGAHTAPVVEGDPRVNLFGVEGPTKGQLSNASRYGLAGTLAAAGLAGLGGMWWKHHQRKGLIDALAHHKTATDWSQLGRNVMGQLPNIRGFDTAAGAGAGALGGLLWHGMAAKDPAHKGKGIEWGNLAKRLGVGALAGAGISNVVGDRARRYLSNNVPLVGYTTEDKFKALKPRSLAQVWRTAIEDKPANDVDQAKGDIDSVSQEGVSVRRELLRRGLGVHTTNPAEDYFTEGKPNEAGLPTVQFNPAKAHQGGPAEIENDPESPVANRRATEYFGSHGRTPATTEGKPGLRIRDTWDFDLHPGEQKWLGQQVAKAIHHPVDFARSLPKPLSEDNDAEYYVAKPGAPDTTKDYLKSLMSRQFLNNVLLKDPARFDQTFPLTQKKGAAQHYDYGELLKKTFFRKYPPEDAGTLPSGMKVKLVDGVKVRNLLLAEFIGGGHSLVYDFIPSDEIWLDNEVAKEDRQFILCHEVYERELIRRGVDYNSAHDQANEIETKFRSMKRDPKTAANRNQDPNIPEDRWLATNAPHRTPTGGRPAKSSNRYLTAGLCSTLERFSASKGGAQIAKKAFANLTRAIVTNIEPSQNEKQASEGPKLRSRAETVVYSQAGVVAIKKEDFLQFPGGGIDPGEEPEFAAYRESIEEADRKLLHLRQLGIQEAVWPKGENIVDGYDGFKNHLYLAMDGGKCGTTHEDNEDFKVVPWGEAIGFLESLKDRKDLQWRRSMIDAELAALREGEKACEDMTAKKLAAELAGSPSQEVAGPRCAVMPHEEPDRTDNSPSILVDLDRTIREWPRGSYAELNAHQIMDGRKETLGPLKGMGFRIIGVTNHSMHPGSEHEGLTPEKLEQIQHETIGLMDGLLDDVVYTEKPDPETLKPAPTMIHFAIKRHGLDPSKSIMVGDNHDHDGGAAEAAGIPFMHADDFFRDPEITVQQIKSLMGHTEEPAEKTADAINLLPRSEYILLNHEGKVLAAPDQGRRYRFPVHGAGEKLPFKTKRAPYQGSLQFVPKGGVAEPGAHGYEYQFHTGTLDEPNAQAEQAFSGLDGGEWQDPHVLLKNLYGSMGRKENAQYRDLDRARVAVLLRAMKAQKKTAPPPPPVHQDPAPQPGMTASPDFTQFAQAG